MTLLWKFASCSKMEGVTPPLLSWASLESVSPMAPVDISGQLSSEEEPTSLNTLFLEQGWYRPFGAYFVQ